MSCGPGIERIDQEVERLFPQARRVVLSSDVVKAKTGTRDGETQPNDAPDMETVLQRMVGHEADILIGTQIVAKGHHFPQLTLVGVVDADLGLDSADPRATERTHQILHQVAGRAGRDVRPGQAFLQTYNPDHPVMGALLSTDRDGFLSAEAAARQSLGFPPFGRLAAIIVSATTEDKAEKHSRALAAAIPRNRHGVEIFGPAPAPLSRLRRRYRWRLLAKAARHVDLSAFMDAWVRTVAAPSDVVTRIDIDPQSFL